jgi:hypothetical protein
MENRQVVNEADKSSGLKQKQNETSQTQKKIFVTHKKQKNTSFLGKAENVVKKRSLERERRMKKRSAGPFPCDENGAGVKGAVVVGEPLEKILNILSPKLSFSSIKFLIFSFI